MIRNLFTGTLRIAINLQNDAIISEILNFSKYHYLALCISTTELEILIKTENFLTI